VIPTWFLYIGGFSLAVLGLLQIIERPRSAKASSYQRFVNVGTLWSLVCITVGVLLVLMALGWVARPDAARPPPPRPHRPAR
jgi:hypothetical protein